MSESVAIVGSRDYPDPAEVRSYVLGLTSDDVVVSGGSGVVDLTAEGAARARGLSVMSYRPVKRHGRWQIIKVSLLAGLPGSINALRPETFLSFGVAAYFRNGLIVDDADRVVAFWFGQSPGTGNTRALAEKAGKPLETRLPMASKP